MAGYHRPPIEAVNAALAHARQDGSYLSFLRSLNKTDVLILDADIHGLKSSHRESKNGFAKLLDTLHQLCPSIYVIALSNLPNQEQNCLQAGANAFACKSDPPDKVLGLLDNLSKNKSGSLSLINHH